MKKLLCVMLATILMLSAIVSASAEDKDRPLGDANLDSVLSIMDATTIQWHAAQLLQLDDTALSFADVNYDGNVDVMDATLIQQVLAQIIPDFPHKPVDEQLLSTANKIKALQNDNTLTFSLISDVHYTGGNSYDDQKLLNISKMGELQDLAQIDFVANLGDFVNGNVEKEDTINSLTELIEYTDNACDSAVFNVRGNHDDNGDYTFSNHGGSNKKDEIINDEEWCDIAFTNLPSGFVIDENNPNGGYGYYDHEKSKIRIFVLNSVDIPYIADGDTYRYNSYTGNAFSDKQLDFVAKSLMFSDKENPNDWAALFLTHVPLDTSNANGECFGVQSALIRGHEYMHGIIAAYRKGTSFKAEGSTYIAVSNVTKDKEEDFMVDVDVDYTAKGSGEVIGFFSGHTHKDNVCKTVDIENSLAYGYTFVGLSGSTSFTNYVIDRDTKTISAVKHGESYPELDTNREIGTPELGSIESGEWSITYDNFLPQDNNLYNGLSEIYPKQTFFDGNTKLDTETLELVNAVESSAVYVVSKAVKLKPFTTYVIPDNFMGTCLAFNRYGGKNPVITPIDHGDYKTITTGIRNYYVTFFFYEKGYSDYNNFYIKELSCNTTF